MNIFWKGGFGLGRLGSVGRISPTIEAYVAFFTGKAGRAYLSTLTSLAQQ